MASTKLAVSTSGKDEQDTPSSKITDMTATTPAAKPNIIAKSVVRPSTPATKTTTDKNASDAPKAFKIVKVRKPDGTIIKVRRPIVPESTETKSSSIQPAKTETSKPGGAEVAAKATVCNGKDTTDQTSDAITPVVAKAEPAISASPRTSATEIASSSNQSTSAGVETLKPTAAAGINTATAPVRKAATAPGQKVATTPTSQAPDAPSTKQTTTADSKSPPAAARGSSPASPGSPKPTEAELAKANRPRFNRFSRFSSGSFLNAIIPDMDLGSGMDATEDGGDMLDGDEEIMSDDSDYDNSDDDCVDSDDDKGSVRGKDSATAAGPTENGQQSSSDGQVAVPPIATAAQDRQGQYQQRQAPSSARQPVTPTTRRLPRGLAPTLSNIFKSRKRSKSTPALSSMSRKDADAENNSASSSSDIAKDKDPLKSAVRVHINEKPVDITERDFQGLDPETGSGGGKPAIDAPQDLNRPGVVLILVWSITICFPLAFIGLGIATRVANGMEFSSPYVQGLEQAHKIALTAWPIFFAAIVAQSLKAFATFRVERGIRLRTLEQLIHSTSFASAVKEPFMLRDIDLMAVALLALWSLSPIASQAIQRMKAPVEGRAVQPVTVYLIDTTAPNPPFNSSDDSTKLLAYGIRDSIDAVYGAATLPRGKQEPRYMDPWRYPIIPSVDEVLGWFGPNDWDPSGTNSSWLTVYNDTGLPSDLLYSSTLGIPYMPLWSSKANNSMDINSYDGSKNGTYSFFLNSTYFNFNCSKAKIINNELRGSIFNNYTETGPSDNITYTAQSYGSSRNTFNLNITVPDFRNASSRGNFTFASLIMKSVPEGRQSRLTSTEMWYTNTCTFNQVFVESDIFCDDRVNQTDCRVRRIRKLPKGSIQAQPIQPFAQNMVDAGTPELFVGSNSNPNTSTFFERYVMDPESVLYNMDPVDLSQVEPYFIGRRIEILFNSYWQAGFAPMYQTGFYPVYKQILDGYDNVAVASLNANFTNTTPIYAIDDGWFAGLILCSCVLLLVAIAGVIWEYVTVAPDILGFANSLVRQSKRVPAPSMAASGQERARMLKEMRVQMQDIRPKAEVGKIALAKVSDDAVKREEKRLKPGRLYV